MCEYCSLNSACKPLLRLLPSFCDAGDLVLRVDPTKDKSDGFFVALFERSTAAAEDVPKSDEGKSNVGHILTPLTTHTATIQGVQNNEQEPSTLQPVENLSAEDVLTSVNEHDVLGKEPCDNALASHSKAERNRKRRLRAIRNKARKATGKEIEFGEVLD